MLIAENHTEIEAIGVLEKNAEGKLAITRVTLRPKITWSAGITVSAEDLAKMHHDAARRVLRR